MIRLSPRSRRQTLLASFAILLVVAALFAVHPAHAQATPEPNWLYSFFSSAVMVAIGVVANLAAIFVHLIVIVSQYNTFINAEIVKTGWAVVMDISNMFFIIALLIIAAGTILRLENYRYNKLLANVIIMAFLANFSKFIAGFFIQTAQVIMLTFVNAYKEAMFGNFATMFGMNDILKFAGENSGNGVGGFAGGTFSILISLVAGLGFMIVVLVVTLAICLVLLVRIIALWILIIVSPFAYSLRIIPNTRKYAEQWWSEFGKYVVVGPVLAFFLWLSLAIVAGTGLTQQDPSLQAIFQEYNVDKLEQTNPFATNLLTIESIMKFLVGVGFLLFALKYATGSGVVGGAVAGKLASKGFAAGATLTGLEAIRNRTTRPVGAWLSARRSRGETEAKERSERIDIRTRQALSATVGQVGRVRTGLTRGAGTLGRGLATLDTKGTTGNIGDVFKRAGVSALEGVKQGTQGRQRTRQAADDFLEQEIGKRTKEHNMNEIGVDSLRNKFLYGDHETSLAAQRVLATKEGIQTDKKEDWAKFTSNMSSVRMNTPVLSKMIEANDKFLQRKDISQDAVRKIAGAGGMGGMKETAILGGVQLLQRRWFDEDKDKTIYNNNQGTGVLDLAEKVWPAQIGTMWTAMGKNYREATKDMLLGGLMTKEGVDRFIDGVATGIFPENLVTEHDVDDTAPEIQAVEAVLEEPPADSYVDEKGERRGKFGDLWKPKVLSPGDSDAVMKQKDDERKRRAGIRKNISQRLTDFHLATGTLDKLGQGMAKDLVDTLFKGAILGEKAEFTDRMKFAKSTGQFIQAFTRINDQGKEELMADQFKVYMRKYRNDVVDAAGIKVVSEPENLKKLFQPGVFMSAKRMYMMMAKNEESRVQGLDALIKVYKESVKNHGELLASVDVNDKDLEGDKMDAYKAQQKMKAAILYTSEGRVMPYRIDQEEDEVTDDQGKKRKMTNKEAEKQKDDFETAVSKAHMPAELRYLDQAFEGKSERYQQRAYQIAGNATPLTLFLKIFERNPHNARNLAAGAIQYNKGGYENSDPNKILRINGTDGMAGVITEKIITRTPDPEKKDILDPKFVTPGKDEQAKKKASKEEDDEGD